VWNCQAISEALRGTFFGNDAWGSCGHVQDGGGFGWCFGWVGVLVLGVLGFVGWLFEGFWNLVLFCSGFGVGFCGCCWVCGSGCSGVWFLGGGGVGGFFWGDCRVWLFVVVGDVLLLWGVWVGFWGVWGGFDVFFGNVSFLLWGFSFFLVGLGGGGCLGVFCFCGVDGYFFVELFILGWVCGLGSCFC